MSDYDEDEMLSGESGGESSTQSMDKEPTVQTTEKGSRWFSRDSASENEEDDTEGQKPATEGKNVRHPIGGYSVKDEEMSESDEEEPSARLEKDLKEIDEDDDHESSPDQPNLPDYYPGIYGCRSVENYEWLNRIEEGTFGVVFRGKEKRTNEIVALKKLKMEKEKEGFPITSLREVCCLLKAKHPNIVHVREIVVGSNMDKIYIVMDFIEHDLKALMETMKQPFLVGEVKTLMLQLLSGVHHLHDNWILHRDLKTSNLLLSHKGILKIGDFGLARDYGSPLKPYTPIVVTLWYRSPELLLGEKVYSTAVDMWSVGCIFGELLLHKPLFQGKSEIDQLNKIFQEMGTPNEKIWPKYPELPHVKDYSFKEQPYLNLRKKLPISVLTNSGFDLINRFLTYDPEKRISAESALEHEYFKETPLPVDPSMFPTWPAKSENVRKGNRERSPSAPVGGAAFRKLADDDESSSFSLSSSSQGKAASGPGFTLKF
jgi:cell division cycle 2-like protein